MATLRAGSERAALFAVILAGGRGSRLAPYTHVIPKPLMPVGELPILEILLRQLSHAGVAEAALAVGHQAALVQAYFGDGSRNGVRLRYSLEDRPLGTAGPIALIPDLPERFFVMNGDLLSDVDFARMWEAHCSSSCAVTVGCTRRTHRIDLGVLHVDHSGRLTGYEEKPSLEYLVSIGIYVFERTALQLLTAGTTRDLPDLVRELIGAGRPVGTYLHEGTWLDIGNHGDYEEANRLFSVERRIFLPHG